MCLPACLPACLPGQSITKQSAALPTTIHHCIVISLHLIIAISGAAIDFFAPVFFFHIFPPVARLLPLLSSRPHPLAFRPQPRTRPRTPCSCSRVRRHLDSSTRHRQAGSKPGATNRTCACSQVSFYLPALICPSPAQSATSGRPASSRKVASFPIPTTTSSRQFFVKTRHTRAFHVHQLAVDERHTRARSVGLLRPTQSPPRKAYSRRHRSTFASRTCPADEARQTTLMSKDFRARVTGIGLVDYVDRLIDEGFDTWDVLVDITEADL